jgi:hypothetical protein
MAKTIRWGGVWSMKHDRELMDMARTQTLEALVEHFQRPPAAILAKAMRLGLSIKRTTKRK